MDQTLRGALAALLLLLPQTAFAIRPFITDDARVVGRGTLQLETWLQIDQNGIQHWVLPAFGPEEHIELTIGMEHGPTYGPVPGSYGIAGPLFQAKVLLHHATMNREPGFAIAGGVQPPAGIGFWAPAQLIGFVFLALTETIGENERVNIHANIGISLSHIEAGNQRLTVIGGVGTQIRTWRGLHVVAEIVHGDSYAGDVGGAVQAGFRYIFGDHVQVDATVAAGTWTGANDFRRPVWGSLGLRLVGNPLF